MADVTLQDIYEYMRTKHEDVVYNEAVALWNSLDAQGREDLKLLILSK